MIKETYLRARLLFPPLWVTWHTACNKSLEGGFAEVIWMTGEIKFDIMPPPSSHIFSNKYDHKCPSSDLYSQELWKTPSSASKWYTVYIKYIFLLRTGFMHGCTSHFMNGRTLWTDVLHFVLLGSLPCDWHLFPPLWVHLYPSYTSIQWSFIAVLELLPSTGFDSALPGCCSVASESTSHLRVLLSKPTFPPCHCPFHSHWALTTHPEIRQTPTCSPSPAHCSKLKFHLLVEPSVISWQFQHKGSTAEALLSF